ncbi:hypothetical protein IWQ55_006169 [Labrenzia sp. EL_208]|nr:hypothetical protein [Labrenzia sp. EL_132]MBG6211566.1 hypothetical protein [Labrenzia sp. EL_126]MBG6232935.1 hypothetical protein [Labrenzia sp. EL_208]
MTEEQHIAIVSVANTLRGMTMDRRIPADARDVLMEKAVALDAVVEGEGDDEE